MQTYDSYKNSGIEWLGEIPSHWEIRKNKYVFKYQKGKNPKNFSEIETENIYLSMDYLRNRNRDVLFLNSVEDLYLVDEGEILLLWDGANAGEFFDSKKGFLSSTMAHLIFNSQSNKRFGKYYLNLIERELRKSTVGMGIPHVSSLELNNLVFALPPISEQEAIVAFLDEKCGKIDELVSVKEQLIALLKERRQVVIHEAVTKGIQPDVVMKDSGIDWIGEIPSHWEVKRLKYVLSSKLKYGANESGFDYDENLPRYIRISDFGFDGKLNNNKKLSLPDSIAKDYLLKDGDILFARSGATVGKAYQFKTSLGEEKSYCFAGYLIKAEPDINQIMSDFLNYYTQSGAFMSWKDSIFNKATIENIGADKYSELNVPIPPISEQEAIVAYLEEQTGKIDQAIALKTEQIEKLKAYKQSLINEVVTGKVRVA